MCFVEYYAQMRALSVSLAYLIYDLVCCLFDKNIKIDNSVHHLVSIVGVVAGLAYEKVVLFFAFV